MALFFHDPLGGTVVAVKLLLPPGHRVPFRVNFPFNAQPALGSEEEEDQQQSQQQAPQLQLHRDAMVAEMVRLGEGLVLGVDEDVTRGPAASASAAVKK